MSTLGYLDAILASASGLAASVEGQRYDVRRLSSASNVSVLSGRPVLAQLPVIMERVTSKDVIEDEPFSLVIFEGDCDWTRLQFGDVLSGSGLDPFGSASSFVYAQHRPTREALFVRTESVATITRPVDAPARAAASALPTANAGPYIVSDEEADVEEGPTADGDVLTLTAGTYAFQPAGSTPAQVPIGIEPTSRTGQPREDAQPTSSDATRFVGYTPALPIQERDEIAVGSKRYLVLEATTRYSGFVGTIMLLVNIGT